MEERWHEIQGWLREVFAWAGVDGPRGRGALGHPRPRRDLRPHRHQAATPTSGEWDVVVVDCAPTAETIRFLSLPDILARYMERLFPVGRRVNKVRVAGAVARHVAAGGRATTCSPPPARFYDRLDGVREILTDPAADQRPPGGEPRAHGDRRGPPHLHLPLAVRVPRRRGGGQPPPARRGVRPVVRAVEGAAPRAPQDHRGGLRARCRCSRSSWRPTELVGLDALRGFGDRRLRRPRRRRPPARGPAAAGHPQRAAPPCRSTCPSPTGTTSSWAGAATSCSCGWAPTGGR